MKRQTSNEAAAALGISGRRVRQLAEAGRIVGALKVGNDWLIPLALRIRPGARGPAPSYVTTKGNP